VHTCPLPHYYISLNTWGKCHNVICINFCVYIHTPKFVIQFLIIRVREAKEIVIFDGTLMFLVLQLNPFALDLDSEN
jgi:hypothetical protein